ncbi:MAG: hypothetical protein A2V88_00825 [Elusimicrobia bacterium RBG_16_66_12]|nr:MAG: hypothetical protein A2V88_00825 [Elusimicrobia bacterium RBG_16_66_12]
MFGSVAAVNGYLMGMPYGGISDPSKPAPASVIKAFQRDFNVVSAAMFGGKIAPSESLRGTLAEDGIPGANTLRALELAVKAVLSGPNKGPWSYTVSKAKA